MKRREEGTGMGKCGESELDHLKVEQGRRRGGIKEREKEGDHPTVDTTGRLC